LYSVLERFSDPSAQMTTTAHPELYNVTDCKQAVAEYTRIKTALFFEMNILSFVKKTTVLKGFVGDMQLARWVCGWV
jgi:hypothetical protein